MRQVLISLVVLAMTVLAIVDIVMIDSSRVRGIPKWAWVSIALFLPILGPLLWFFIGRERLSKRNHGRYPDRPVAPDDDPAFLGKLSRDKEQEQRIRDLEERLAELDDDDDKPKSA